MEDSQLITFNCYLHLDREQLKPFNRRYVYFRRINREGLSFVYPLIEEWKCKTLKNDGNRFPTGGRFPDILKEIANINFPSLTHL